MSSKEAKEYVENECYGLPDPDSYDDSQLFIEEYKEDIANAYDAGRESTKELIKQLQDDVDKYTKLWEESYTAWCQLSEKTKWHYISEGDLPKDDKNLDEYPIVLVMLSDKTISTGGFDGDGWIVDSYHDGYDTWKDPIAWCELPVLPEVK